MTLSGEGTFQVAVTADPTGRPEQIIMQHQGELQSSVLMCVIIIVPLQDGPLQALQ